MAETADHAGVISSLHGLESPFCAVCQAKLKSSSTRRSQRMSRIQLQISLLLSTAAFIFSFAALAFVLLYVRFPPENRLHYHTAEEEEGNTEAPGYSFQSWEDELAQGETIQRNLTSDAMEIQQKRSVQRRSGGNRRKRRGGNGGKKRHRVTAVHYVPKGTDGLGFTGKNCLEYEETTICRNNTAFQRKKDTDVMKNFWILSTTKTKKTLKSPFQLIDGRLVKVLKAGYYEIYSQAVFLESMYRTSLEVNINGVRMMRCVESRIPVSDGSSYQSCAVRGVFYLDKSDEVSVKYPYSKTQIDLKSDTTFFGLVHLSK